MQKFTPAQARDAIKSALDSFLDKKFTLKSQDVATDQVLQALGFPLSQHQRRKKTSERCFIAVSDGQSTKPVAVKPQPYGTLPPGSIKDGCVISTPEIG